MLRRAFGKKGKPYWTTADGSQIRYEDLSDAHLRNIIKDGYRNVRLYDEVARRGWKMPKRLVDNLDWREIFTWVESFASTALSGNEFASYMTNLWNKDKAGFMVCLEMFLKKHENKLCNTRRPNKSKSSPTSSLSVASPKRTKKSLTLSVNGQRVTSKAGKPRKSLKKSSAGASTTTTAAKKSRATSMKPRKTSKRSGAPSKRR